MGSLWQTLASRELIAAQIALFHPVAHGRSSYHSQSNLLVIRISGYNTVTAGSESMELPLSSLQKY